jgi:hypothetical protein
MTKKILGAAMALALLLGTPALAQQLGGQTGSFGGGTLLPSGSAGAGIASLGALGGGQASASFGGASLAAGIVSSVIGDDGEGPAGAGAQTASGTSTTSSTN